MTTESRTPARRLAHRRAPQPRHAPPQRERGYTMVMTAIVLVPLMAFAGLSVDVGSWYARGAQLQRAADAAALAGAALMPDFTAASAEARATATKNSFTTGGPITVSVTQKDERKIAVTIADSNVKRYFSSLFMSNMSMSRTATAEFVLPVPLGSPDNYFGNDPINPPVVGQPGLWGNIHGRGTDDLKGDRYGAGCRGANDCASPSNTEYRPYYLYALDVPAGAGTVSMQVYDAGLYDRGGNETVETGDRAYGTTGVTTTWELFGPDQTVIDYTDAPSLAGSGTCGAGPGKFVLAQEADAATYKNKWAPICTMAAAAPGRYWLKVATSGNGDGANRYSLRATATGTAKPTLSAFRDMSMFNNQLSVNPNFFLAKVDQIHRGKTFLVSLYDPGEIGVADAHMEILLPDGSVASACKLSVYNAPTDSSPASTTSMSPCSIATTDSGGGALFNGKLLSIEIKIPATYTCSTCWWKVRYDLGPSPSGTPSDTTTWSAAIKGDPVHLVNE